MDAARWASDSPFAQDKEGWNDVNAFFRLSDEGYDVWMGNNRATRYSSKNYRYPDADEERNDQYLYPE